MNKVQFFVTGRLLGLAAEFSALCSAIEALAGRLRSVTVLGAKLEQQVEALEKAQKGWDAHHDSELIKLRAQLSALEERVAEIDQIKAYQVPGLRDG